MKANEAIRTIVDSRGMKYSALAFRLNLTRAALYERLTQKNLSLLKFDEILKALGYKIVIVPYNTPVKDGQFEITTEE